LNDFVAKTEILAAFQHASSNTGWAIAIHSAPGLETYRWPDFGQLDFNRRLSQNRLNTMDTAELGDRSASDLILRDPNDPNS